MIFSIFYNVVHHKTSAIGPSDVTFQESVLMHILNTHNVQNYPHNSSPPILLFPLPNPSQPYSSDGYLWWVLMHQFQENWKAPKELATIEQPGKCSQDIVFTHVFRHKNNKPVGLLLKITTSSYKGAAWLFIKLHVVMSPFSCTGTYLLNKLVSKGAPIRHLPKKKNK